MNITVRRKWFTLSWVWLTRLVSVSSHQSLGLGSVLFFAFRYLTKILYAFIASRVCYMSFLHRPLPFFTLILCVEGNAYRLLTHVFLHRFTSSVLDASIFYRTLPFNTRSLCYGVKVRKLTLHEMYNNTCLWIFLRLSSIPLPNFILLLHETSVFIASLKWE